MTLWNAARAASKRALPKPRKMHAPVGEKLLGSHLTTGTDKFDDRGQPYACTALGRVTEEPTKCRDCGYHVCSCEAAFEAQQEAQRAEFAYDAESDRWGYRWPQPVQKHLRQGDPRRMSLGYNERDYDESRRANMLVMQAELRGLRTEHNPVISRELNEGVSLDEIERRHWDASQRAIVLQKAILEHERKLPKVPLIDPSKPMLPPVPINYAGKRLLVSKQTYDALQAEYAEIAKHEKL